MVSKSTILTYPDWSKPFDIHTNASDTQLGAVISQNDMPIAFYSRKINSAQQNYTTMERELLAIVDTLKEYQNILYGQDIKIHTDHKNLTCVNFNTQRVIRWQMVIEDFGPELAYIPGPTNVIADAISRLDRTNTRKEKQTNCNSFTKKSLELADLFTDNTISEEIYPLNFKLIQKEQVCDTKLIDYAAKTDGYSLQNFHGGGKSHQ